MAEVSNTRQEKETRIRSKKMSIKIDMTPMVDLAFLLLTFFILTATLQKTHVMDVAMPDRTQADPPVVNHEKVLNVLLAENNRIYWWKGLDQPVYETDFSSKGIRNVLNKAKTEIGGLVVLIKPKDSSKYHNIVDLLDELSIIGIERYAIVDVTDDDDKKISDSK